MTTGSSSARLSSRARLTWLAHLFKACVKQHHRELITPLRRFIPEDAVVLDAGGHAGQFAKLFARMAPNGHVYTVEPGSYALSIMRPAIRFNKLRNITILPVGLSDSPGTATLHVPVKERGSLGYGLSHITDITEQRARRPSISDFISLTTIDLIAVSEDLRRLDFIKADIEGWELRMIFGAEQTLLRFRPNLMVEVNSEALARAGDTPDSLFSYFASIDYHGYILEPDMQRFHPVKLARNNDVFFVPSERSSIMDGTWTSPESHGTGDDDLDYLMGTVNRGQNVGFGCARMIIAQTDDVPVAFNVFRDLDSARDWLEIPAEYELPFD